MSIRRLTLLLAAAVLVAPACGRDPAPLETTVGAGSDRAGPAPSTTALVATAEPSPSPSPSPSRTRTSPPTTASRAGGGEAAAVPGDEEPFDGIWPYSRAVLDQQAAAFDAGHQPWRADPVAVARQYLDALAAANPELEPVVVTASDTDEVAFEAGGVPGSVVMGRVDGHPLPYVVRLTSSRVAIEHVERDGPHVRLRVTSQAPGTIRARAGHFASEWYVEQAEPAPVGGEVVLTLPVDDQDSPLLVQVRHEGADGRVALVERRAQPVGGGSPSARSR